MPHAIHPSVFIPFHSSERLNTQGLTILEVTISAAILATALGSFYVTLGRGMTMVQNANFASGAQENTVTRIEQLRTKGWSYLTDPAKIQTLLSTSTESATNNVTITEEVISVYPINVPQTVPTPSPAAPVVAAASTSPYFTVTKTGSSTPVISPASAVAATTLAQRQLSFRVKTVWESGGRTFQREISTVFSRSASR